MIIKRENIFESACTYDAICVTTNGIVNRQGKLVMGAGLARQFNKNYPGLDYELGQKINTYGNQPFLVYKKKQAIVSFPTKNNWKDKSDIELIVNSAKKINRIAQSRFWGKVAIPAPGIGLGGLSWKTDVYPRLKNILDDRFHILFHTEKK